jgi:hypothetical protein
VIRAGRAGEALARFPARLQSVAWSPTHRVWAARRENHLFLLRLEGSPPVAEQQSSPPAPAGAEEDAPCWLEDLLPAGGSADFPLVKACTTIGREGDCDICLDRPTVSRRHAQVVEEGDGFALEDLGSTNGTFVNGERVQKAVLRHGDRIRVCEATFVFDERDKCLRRVL